MARFFNIAGPCNPADHYMIDASERLTEVASLIDSKQYFVIHAARQSGKTTLLWDLTAELNKGGRYYALNCSLEAVQGVTDPKEGIPAILSCLTLALRRSPILRGVRYPERFDGPVTQPMVAILDFLTELVALLDKPLVIFFDEADCLSEGTLIAFLRQLRDGHNGRIQTPFVHSLALVGMRNIRDYKAMIRSERETMGSASPFNIVTKSLTLKNFSDDEIRELYGQHTADTGQVFEPDAIRLACEKTQGQPWLVNAVAREVVVEMLESDYSKPVTAALIEQAIQNIIIRRDTHIDSLRAKLREEPVKRIIRPMLSGDCRGIDWLNDFRYCQDIGLVRKVNDRLEAANPIYKMVYEQVFEPTMV